MRIPLCDRLPSTDPNRNCAIVPLSARPRFDEIEQRFATREWKERRHYVCLVIFEILEFTFLYSYHFLASFECEKAFHDEVSLSSFEWINSNWVISRRDWFWKRTFLKMGTINTKCRYRYYIDLKFFHLYVYIHLYIHTLVCIFEMKIWIRYESVCLSFTDSQDEFELGYYVNESCLLQRKTAIVSIFRYIKSSKIVRFF